MILPYRPYNIWSWIDRLSCSEEVQQLLSKLLDSVQSIGEA